MAKEREAVTEAVKEFVAQRTGKSISELSTGSRLEDLGVCGDDFAELMADFSERFAVDLRGYRWYCHHEPEGFNPLHRIFRPWWAKARRMPVTIALLSEAAAQHRWPVTYPDPELVPRRSVADLLLLAVLAAMAALVLYAKLFA